MPDDLDEKIETVRSDAYQLIFDIVLCLQAQQHLIAGMLEHISVPQGREKSILDDMKLMHGRMNELFVDMRKLVERPGTVWLRGEE